MFCIHCGKELPEDARFCSRCGKPQPDETILPENDPFGPIILPGTVSPPEPPEIPQPPQDPPKPPPTPVPELGQEFYDALAAAFEQEDSIKPEEPPVPAIPVPPPTEALSTVTPPEPPVEWKPPVAVQKLFSRKNMLPLIGVVLLVIALAAVLVRLVTPQPIGEDAFVYMSADQHRLMFRKDLKSGTQPKELSNVSGYNMTFSEDGKHLYYINSGNLYCSDLSKAGEWNATEKVSSDVKEYEVMKNGGAVYLTVSGADFRMYYYDGWDSIQLADNANSSFTFADETEKVVYYTVQEEDDTNSYWCVPVDGSAEPEKMIDDFDDILYLSSDTVVYTKREGSYGLVEDWYESLYISGTVYSQVPGGEKALLADNVGGVLRVTDGKGKISMIYMTVYDIEAKSCDLCRYEDGETEVLVSGIGILPSYSYNDDIYIFARRNAGGGTTYYQKIGGVESEFPLEEGTDIFRTFFLSGGEVVLYLGTPDGEKLQSYKAGKNQLEPGEVVSAGDFSNLFYGPYGDKTALYYYMDVEHGEGTDCEGTLMRYVDGKSTVVAEEVGNVLVLTDGSGVFDVDKYGVIYRVGSDGKKEAVSSETTDYTILNGRKIAYVSNENLYLWDGGKSEKLLSGVASVFVPHEAEYMLYHCY